MGQAVRLASNFVVLDDSLNARVVELTPHLHTKIDEQFSDFKGHLLISSYAYDEDWPAWEVHSAGDEFVILVSGDADLVLVRGQGDETIRMTEPGTFVIVPRNTWHTARIHKTSIMMFVTPGEGTINAVEPPRE